MIPLVSPSLKARRLFPGSTFVAAVVGAAAAGAQVVLLRELIIAAGGNELAAGMALTCWMLGTAAGSAAGGVLSRRLLRRRSAIRAWVWAGLCAAVLLVPLALPVAGWSRRVLGPGAGEVVGLHQVLGMAGLTLVPPCLFLGLLFPVVCRLAEREGRTVGGAAGHVFGVEALAFGAAGTLTSLVLVARLAPGTTLQLLAGAMALAALLVALGGKRTRVLWTPIPVVLLLGVSVMVPPRSDRGVLYGREPALTLDTARSRVEVVTGDGQSDVYVDGLWSFAVPDREAAEYAVHPAMLQHPDPRDILLVGGAVSGALGEVLRHPGVRRVDVVEGDPGLLQAARLALPIRVLSPLDDPRVALHLGDGRAFVDRVDRAYDVVILAVGDPRSVQLNRFYTVEFCREVAAVLGEGGVLGLSVAGSRDMLGPAQARYVATFRTTLRRVFGDVAAFPGDRVGFVARVEPGSVVRDPAVLAGRMAERGLGTRFLKASTIDDEWGPLRMQYLEDVLGGAGGGDVNRDLAPTCFYLDTLLWTTAHAPRLGAVVGRLGGVRAWWFVAALAAAGLACVAAARRGPRAGRVRRAAVPAAVAVTGATGIGLELMVILGYQVAYGNLLARIGVVVAAFMLGMALGAHLLASGRVAATWRSLAGVQIALAAVCGALWVVAAGPGVAGLSPWLEPLFAAVTAAVGCAAGIHFPCAVHVRAAVGIDRGAGGLYALDLAASAGASLVLATAAIPVLGVPAVLGLLVLANLAAAALLAASRPSPSGGRLALRRER